MKMGGLTANLSGTLFMGNSISEIGEIPGKSTMVSGFGVSYERVKGLIQLK